MRKKNNKTITAIGMAALLTAAGVITACAAQSPTIVAGSSTAQAEAEQEARRRARRHRSGAALRV